MNELADKPNSTLKVPVPWRGRLKKGFYVFVGLLLASVLILSLVQAWVIYTASDVVAYGVVQADEQGWPQADQRGAFLMLADKHNPLYPGNLVELLATTEPGVVDEKAGAHIVPAEIKAVLVQSAILNEASEYRVYRLGDPDQTAMKATRQPGGKVMIFEPKDGVWVPGAYLVDIPSEGMFGGRTYYQFYVDAAK